MKQPFALLAALIYLGAICVVRADSAPVAGPMVPVDLAWGGDGLLRVALRDAMRIAVIDPKEWTVTSSQSLPFAPSSLHLSRQGVVYVGGQYGEVARLKPNGGLTILRTATGRGPTRVLPLENGEVAVASRWDDRLRILDDKEGRESRSIALGFPPGALCRGPRSDLHVADAFLPRISRVDVKRGIVSTVESDGVNIRGLRTSASGRELLFVNAAQYQAAPLTNANLDWGLVLSSGLESIPLDEFGQGGPREPPNRLRLSLDGSKHGAADPADLAESPDGRSLYVAVAGADQVLRTRRVPSRGNSIATLGEYAALESAPVGKRPVSIVLDPSGTFVITADAGSDTLTILKSSDLSVVSIVRLGPSDPPRNHVQRGELIFHEGRRSLDGWLNCASCHPEGHTNGLNFDTLGDGAYGASKNTPSLLGVGETPPFGWTGRFKELLDQSHQSVIDTMKGQALARADLEDLVAYLRSLRPPPPRHSDEDPLVRLGATVFQENGCHECHRPPHFTTRAVRAVTLGGNPPRREVFNPPSLRGLGWSAPYFHDGSAATLDDVLERHHPLSPAPIPSEDRSNLRAYLESL